MKKFTHQEMLTLWMVVIGIIVGSAYAMVADEGMSASKSQEQQEEPDVIHGSEDPSQEGHEKLAEMDEASLTSNISPEGDAALNVAEKKVSDASQIETQAQDKASDVSSIAQVEAAGLNLNSQGQDVPGSSLGTGTSEGMLAAPTHLESMKSLEADMQKNTEKKAENVVAEQKAPEALAMEDKGPELAEKNESVASQDNAIENVVSALSEQTDVMAKEFTNRLADMLQERIKGRMKELIKEEIKRIMQALEHTKSDTTEVVSSTKDTETAL